MFSVIRLANMHVTGLLTLMAVIIVKTAAVSLLTGDNVHNSTKQDLAGVNGQNVDVFRQLLNQETLIRMNMVQNVHALMKDMLTLKEKLAVAEQKISTLKASTDHEILVLKTEVQSLKLENNVLKNESRVQRRHLTEMIDQKILVMFESMNSSLENFNATLLDTDNRFSAQISDLKNLHSGVLSTVTGYVNRTIDSLKAEMKNSQIKQLKLSSAVTSLEMFRMNLTNNKRDLKKTVAFTAGVTSSSSTWNSGTLVFPAVINNIGGGYNPSTGIFTAPTDGHYVFFVTVVEYDKQHSMVDIVLNGSSKVRTVGNSNAAYQTGANMAVLRLEQGDTVWIKHDYGKGYYTESVPTTTFSGFLL